MRCWTLWGGWMVLLFFLSLLRGGGWVGGWVIYSSMHAVKER